MKPAAAVSEPAGDPLADALLFLAAHHGRAISREALLAGLPILDGDLPPPLFERAATKAGLEAKALRRRLSEIPALVLPAVLRCAMARPCAPAGDRPRHQDCDGRVTDPELEYRSPVTRPQRALRRISRLCIFCPPNRSRRCARCRRRVRCRAPTVLVGGPRRFWWNHSHVATAALISEHAGAGGSHFSL